MSGYQVTGWLAWRSQGISVNGKSLHIEYYDPGTKRNSMIKCLRC